VSATAQWEVSLSLSLSFKTDCSSLGQETAGWQAVGPRGDRFIASLKCVQKQNNGELTHANRFKSHLTQFHVLYYSTKSKLMQNSYAIIQNPIAFAWQPFLALFFLRSE
jgi:hypothetical protein